MGPAALLWWLKQTEDPKQYLVTPQMGHQELKPTTSNVEQLAFDTCGP